MESTELLVQWDSGKYQYHRKLGAFVSYFQMNMNTNNAGIPFQLVNARTIAENMLDCQTTDDLPEEVLEAATVDVDFDDGMPIVDGLPIWERLEGELVEYFKYFKYYRDSLYVSGSRALTKTAEHFKVEGKIIQVLSKVYHWAIRCKAFDFNKKVERERFRQFQIQKLESSHMSASATLLEQGLAYLEAHPEQLNPKVAIQMVEVAMKSGRLALGLSGDKPAAPNINIHQTANTSGSEVSMSTEINSGGGKSAEPDASYLQSIVHILDQSGALDQAKQDALEAEYEELPDDAEAIEGT